MKERISVTLDKEIIRVLNSLVKDRKYRNRSHAVEMAIEQLGKNEKDDADAK
ncbi:MAG: ribbon-helix-helix domain-containing protein [Nanoarchaeota archaeon]